MFKVAYRRVTDVEPFVYPACPTGEGALGLGTAAVLTAGVLAKCGASVKPTHIVMGPPRADGTCPAIGVTENTVFETTSTATVAETVIGSAVTLAADAQTVTATTTSGVFKILETDGAATASTVRGVFVEPPAAAG
ncbi:hypothetical protein H8S45_14865 [Agathobaculum sp. NSJ-28]|uniref:Uncharacterized protein n=1 Tax=Agathobaculum faecis TaxID=2763013 RepID=A0A923LX02_9FIRM|nr:hypothetical protein [Agathobaculum faecis]MBC5726729.1 hypothetical protein [Agathobaculum faecis]